MLPNQKSFRRLVKLTLAFALFRQGNMPTDKIEKALREINDESKFSRIRCPQCKWQPNSHSTWFCGDGGPPEYFRGCGTEWNTFDTRGRCPGCSHLWLWTACLWCGQYSPHEDWYTDEKE